VHISTSCYGSACGKKDKKKTKKTKKTKKDKKNKKKQKKTKKNIFFSNTRTQGMVPRKKVVGKRLTGQEQ
jgi:hypothetical protein